jgi:hypothetical protein
MSPVCILRFEAHGGGQLLITMTTVTVRTSVGVGG